MHFLKLEFSYINQITEIKNTRDVLRDYVSAYLEMMIMAWAPNLFKRKKKTGKIPSTFNNSYRFNSIHRIYIEGYTINKLLHII